MKKLYVIGANYGNAGKMRGAEIGSSILKRYVLSKANTEDGGDIVENELGDNRGLDCISELSELSDRLKKMVSATIQGGKAVFTVGGDHSISLGSISGAIEAAESAGEKLGVIYLDAHGDINTIKTSKTKNLHGMVLSFAMGIGESVLSKIANPSLMPENLLYIGSRSLDPGEKELIERYNICLLSSYYINCADESSRLDLVGNVISDFIEIHRIERVHLSIDIDAVDPMQAPGTGVPEINGLDAKDFLWIVEYTLKRCNVKSVDLVEFNPKLDVDGQTERICMTCCDIVTDYMEI